MPEEILITKLRTDCGTQMRAKIDPATVTRYAEDVASLPPITVFHDGTHHYVADGFHRVEAHKEANCKSITCEVRPGTLRDAVLFACGANREHGLPRSNDDKRRAVEVLLRDEEWGARSDKWISEQAKVSNHLVSDVRNELFPKKTTRQHGEFQVEQKTTCQPEELPVERVVESKDGKTRKVVERPATKITGGVTFNVDEFTATPEEPAAPDVVPEEPEPVDGMAKDGRPIPARLSPAFECVKRLRGMVMRIGALKTECEELIGLPVGPHFDHDDTRRSLEQAAIHLKNATPTLPCPRCKGAGKPCEWCKGTGYITRAKEGMLSDMDKKWLNQR